MGQRVQRDQRSQRMHVLAAQFLSHAKARGNLDAAICIGWQNWINPLGCSNFSGALSSFLGMFAIVGIIHPTLTTIGVGSDSCCWLIAEAALIRQRVKDHGCQTLTWFDDSRMNPGPRGPHV